MPKDVQLVTNMQQNVTGEKMAPYHNVSVLLEFQMGMYLEGYTRTDETHCEGERIILRDVSYG